MLSADLGPVDDHETVTWQGPDGRIALAEVPTLLATTEVGNFGETSRFRPVAYTLKLLESWAFGHAPPLWYLVRTLLLGLAAGAFAGGLSALLERALATTRLEIDGGAVLLARWLIPVTDLVVIQGLPVWEGIANRLGPSENYAMLAIAMVVGLASRRPRAAGGSDSSRRAGIQLLLLSATFTALVFTKETLVSLGPLLAVAAWQSRSRVSTLWLSAAAVVAASGPLLLVAALGSSDRLTAGDVYGRSFGPYRIYETGLVWIRSPWLALLLVAALGAAVLLDRRGIVGVRGLQWWVLASGAAQFIDMFGHAGEAWLRYRLVLDLGLVFQGSVVFVALTVLVLDALHTGRIDRAAQRWIALAVAGVVATAAAWGGFAVRDRDGRAQQRAAMASEFNDAVNRAAETVGPEGLVIIVLEGQSDSEWGAAAQSFLLNRHGGVASAVITRDGDRESEVRSLTMGPTSPMEAREGPQAAAAAGVPVVCLSLLRSSSTAIPSCDGLVGIDHPR